MVSGVTISDYSVGNDIYTDRNMPTLSDLTADGTQYNAARDAIYDEELLYNYSKDIESQMRDATYDIYLDSYGNLLGLEQVDAVDNYIFVVGYDVGSSVLAKATDKALVIHTDGTMEQVEIDDSKLEVYDGDEWVDAKDNRLVSSDEESINAWFTYTVDEDGLYTLRRMVRNQGFETRTADDEDYYIDAKHGTLTTAANPDVRLTGHEIEAATAYGNNDSVYITVEADDSVSGTNSIVDVRGVTTGLRNASIRAEAVSFQFDDTYSYLHNTYFMYDDDGYVTYAVVVGEDGAANNEYIYLTSKIIRTTNDEANDRYLYTYEAIVDGEWTTIQSEVNRANTVATYSNGTLTEEKPADYVQLTAGNLYRAEVDNDGIITEMLLLPETKSGEMYPELNADYGYTYKVDNANDATDAITLKTNGRTLWVIQETTQDNYTLLTDDVVFFVQNPDSSEDDYDVFTDPERAVRATEANNVEYVYSVATVNDPVTGYARAVIIDLVYESDPENPAVVDEYHEFDWIEANLDRNGSLRIEASIEDMANWDVSNNAQIQVSITNPDGAERTRNVTFRNSMWDESTGTLTIDPVPSTTLTKEGTYTIELTLTFVGTDGDTTSYSVSGETDVVQF